MDVAVGIAQIVLGGAALWVAWRALVISNDVQASATRERELSDLRQRLMWMQTLLNEVEPLWIARRDMKEFEFENRQRWMLTVLASGALRDVLPHTRKMAEVQLRGDDNRPVSLADVGELGVRPR